MLIDQRLGTARQWNQTALHSGSGADAFCAREGLGVSLAPVPGLLSIAAGLVIVEVLVGWSPALPRRSPPPPQKYPGVRADFLHVKNKKKMYKRENAWIKCKEQNIYI